MRDGDSTTYQHGYSITVDGWRFRVASAAYVDVHPPGSSNAVDCINTYDYEQGTTTLRGRGSLKRLAREWLADNQDHLTDYMMMG